MSKKRIYTVATSHLDTVWSWDFETTVSHYIYDTLVDNIALFKKYPSYTFSFEGAYRYELMEEYYPKLFEEMKEYISQGRWNVCGSAYENGDTNCPSPEALFRNILFGNSYFNEKFNKRSVDIYLPDCFGFGWALPSIACHAHLKGFTTQKLAWGSAYGIPFDIGKWKGVDGSEIYACLNPHDYYYTLTKLRDWDFVLNKLKENEKFGLDWTYIFHGIGDRGGAPEEASVKFVDSEIRKNSDSAVEVVAAAADKIYRDIENDLPQEVRDNLPVWGNELVMQNHGVGGYTSRAIGKRWNSKCQELGDMAEKAGVLADFFGTGSYNEDVLEKSWKRVIAHQFHDDIPGTSVERAYRRSWNDYALSMNQFSGELEASLASLSALAKTDFCTGIPLMVFNSTQYSRSSPVKARLKNVDAPSFRVYNNKGRELKSQINKLENGITELLFIADVDALGFAVFDARPSKQPCSLDTSLSINDCTMENQKYIVRLNKNGDISSIIDKQDNERELLSAPIVLGQFRYTGSKDWPAWEMNYDEANREPDRIPQLVSVKIAESGCARVAFEVKQSDGKSDFTNLILLTDGGNTVEVYSEIEWRSMRTMCKNIFSFTAENEKAVFDLGLGAIERTNMSEKLFEVPAQKWADITDKSNAFGISVLSECKHGWDKFNDKTLRLTAIHTPKRNYRIDSMQSMMDLGLNRYSFAIFSHKGKVGAQTQREAQLYSQPLTAMVLDRHQGRIGSEYSFIKLNGDDVILRALKMPHHNIESGEVIVRFNEGANKNVKDFTFTMGEGIESARELWASEEYKADASVEGGALFTSFKPYEVKTFALKLKKPSALKKDKPVIKPVKLEYNSKFITKQDEKCDEFAYYIPREIIPERINAFGGEFTISQDNYKNALVSAENKITVSKTAKSLKLLCTGHLNKDFAVKFTVDGNPVYRTVNSDEQAYAAWDLYNLGDTAYVKSGHLGFDATHAHDKNGRDIYAKNIYLWVITIEVDGNSVIELSDNSDLIILSACESSLPAASLVTLLYDEVSERSFTFRKSLKEKLWYLHSKCVWMLNDKDDFVRHNNNGKNGRRVEQSKKKIKSRTLEKAGH